MSESVDHHLHNGMFIHGYWFWLLEARIWLKILVAFMLEMRLGAMLKSYQKLFSPLLFSSLVKMVGNRVNVYRIEFKMVKFSCTECRAFLHHKECVESIV